MKNREKKKRNHKKKRNKNFSDTKRVLKLNKELSLDEVIDSETLDTSSNAVSDSGFHDKSHASLEKNKRRKREKTKKKRYFRRIILFILLVLVIVSVALMLVSAYQWKLLAKEMFVNENSIVVDSDGNSLAALGSQRIHQNVSLSDLPDYLKNAYVAIEDKRFYKHSGVDVKRTASAIFSYVIHAGSSSFGGSTITQQLVKNMTGDNSNSISRKVKEWFKAFELEQIFSKDEILETYLNVIYVGPNIYGVEMGSQYYFNKSVNSLTLAEAAFLAGINNTPNSYNPFKGDENLEKIKNRTKTVLNLMLEQGYISEEDCSTAKSEVDVGLHFSKGTVEAKENGIYDYHTDATISEVISDICKQKNISETFATNYLYMAGLTIHSTQDSSIQSSIEKEFENDKYLLKSASDPSVSAQAAMVVIDHSNGQVRGCVGALGEKTTARGFNRATQSVRQTGSSSKPLAVLVPALDKKVITAASMFDDVLTEFENGDQEENYTPTNYNDYLGNITVRRAIESSQNVPFVKIMQSVKPKTAIKYMEKMGITTLNENDNNLSLALGGLDKGISPLEMAGGYATIANNGIYIEPTFYTTVTSSDGKVLFESKQKTRKVFSEDVAFIIKELLTEPVTGSNGTATYCSISNMDVAAKTGTTNENFDKWLCGFTNYYTAVTWYGFDLSEPIDFHHQNPAGVLWASVMRNIHSQLSSSKFTMPDNVISEKVCPSSGLLASSACPDAYVEYFLRWTEPKEYCQEHSSSTSKKTTNSNTSKTQNVTSSKESTSKQSSENTQTNTTFQSSNSVSSQSEKKEENKISNHTSNQNTNQENLVENSLHPTTNSAPETLQNTSNSQNTTNQNGANQNTESSNTSQTNSSSNSNLLSTEETH